MRMIREDTSDPVIQKIKTFVKRSDPSGKSLVLDQGYVSPSTRYQTSQRYDWAILVYTGGKFGVGAFIERLAMLLESELELEILDWHDTRAKGWDGVSFKVESNGRSYKIGYSSTGTNYTPITINIK